LKQSATNDRRGKRVGDHLGSLAEWSSRLTRPRTGKTDWSEIGCMALSSKRKIIWDQREGGEQADDTRRSPSFNPQRIVRWVAVPGASAAVGLWLIGTVGWCA